MERKQMKRVNVILEADLYEKARAVAFVKRKSLSEIVRKALGDWLSVNVDAETELVLSEKDEQRLIRILMTGEFVTSDKAKKSLGLWMNVFYSKTSLKFLSKLGEDMRAKIVSAVDGLPDRGDIQKMRGQTLKNVFRLRVGRYRILYIREADAIRILDIDTRGDIYK
jgi:mRNA-degrading endonuclease RelE of RelBE toxin-antitoxin system